jgi:glycosyltransferase involved in cell wall biosynthesis
MQVETLIARQSNSLMEGIVESKHDGIVVLSPANRQPSRRVLYVNLYGGASIWEKVKKGIMPPHHLWGCLELARMGYEVALAEPVWNFEIRKAYPHDLKLLKMARNWLRPDDIIYCGHNVLFWMPLLKRLGLVRSHLVSLLYAREPLNFGNAHSGVIALNPAATDQAKKLAPRAKVAHLGWGADLNYFPRLPYRPEWFLSCGITRRDHRTLSEAAALCGIPIRVICPGLPAGVSWPSNVDVVDGGRGWNFEKDVVSYKELLHDYYGECAASVICLTHDPIEYHAIGFTNLIEAMAMARPVVMTRTGTVPREIDLELAGCGLYVPPNNPAALAEAIAALANDPKRAQEMGEKGRELAESHYNIDRFASGLHQFFESL